MYNFRVVSEMLHFSMYSHAGSTQTEWEGNCTKGYLLKEYKEAAKLQLDNSSMPSATKKTLTQIVNEMYKIGVHRATFDTVEKYDFPKEMKDLLGLNEDIPTETVTETGQDENSENITETNQPQNTQDLPFAECSDTEDE